MDRVIFQKNPLVEVILQFRFPTILLINANDPVEFQDAIRKNYPIYQPGIENEQEIQVLANNNTFLPSIVNKQQHKNYAFISADGNYKINLTSSSISISTVSYTRWEEFWGQFEPVLSEFIKIYAPAFFERIGLRYINAISKERLGLQGKKWKELIKNNWLGVLANNDDGQVVMANADTECILSDDISRVKIHTGIGKINGTAENVFIVDTDFIHIRNIKTSEYLPILLSLHDNSKFFIKFVITNELYEAMEPREI